MFDRCRVWRRLLSRQAEGLLTPSERALLDSHLTRCAACREAEAADKILHSAYSGSRQHMNARAARAFDDRVLQALHAQPEPARANALQQRVSGFSLNLSFEFWGQLAGGALMAASVTAFFLVSALHPTPAVRANSATDVTPLSSSEPNAPPVSLEALFQTRSPRAALLWATPAGSQRRVSPHIGKDAPASVPAANPRSEPRRGGASPGPHSEQPRSVSVG